MMTEKEAGRTQVAPAGVAQRLSQMEMLLSISRQVAANETLEEMLKTIIQLTTEKIHSERGSIFLNDERTGELYTRYAQGNIRREIRILNNQGVAGHVFQSGQGVIIPDAYQDERFDSSVDKETGFVTRSILCAPIRTAKGVVIGVVQSLNKREGVFTEEDLKLLEAMTQQASIVLENTQQIERMEITRKLEMEFLEMVSDITSEIEIDSLLQKVIREATRLLQADRGTLFLNDEKTNELFSRVAMGGSIGEIRLPNHVGIAGAVFTSGETINIPYAYADLRFNPAFDKKTGYFTRSIICIPVVNKEGRTIGVTQMLNKKGGSFNQEDESRLKAFTAQVAIALENAKLFEDVQRMKNYNESVLESMTNGVITINAEGIIETANAASLKILRVALDEVLKKPAREFFIDNAWVMERVDLVSKARKEAALMDVELDTPKGKVSANLTILPLISGDDKDLGTLIMIEDISSEKRMKSTMSRYMDPGLAAQLMDGEVDLLGGKSVEATVVFTDIRSFTTLTEELGPQGTVKLLNEYFTLMVDCIQEEGGMLDKFIGDAMMAAFGLPIPKGDDEDRAVRAAIAMIDTLNGFNVKRAREGKMAVHMGIGLNTDTVVSGNIGSPKRMDYTMIGDGVNLAARLESACKQYAAQILISENTFRKLRGTYRIREVDKVIVKGKTRPVSIYEVLDYHNEESFPNLMESVNYFKDGFHHYQGGRFEKAIIGFQEALKLNPADALVTMYIGRCEQLLAHPPEGHWDGVWVMETK
ncbi:MAG: GAF domain-containing protein [Magnetococcales bacterium]|nr:GAF domain-containing protein [Magnetococcales bacterium]MBF0151297.1 GAF domain-containing protein [Magnetococcales bacterium]MBF0346147.1 GAF domain-containing protein [Magnetococcales bacterium]MBF0630361.1 GAF domain-containing protein [Magnetococcales bacterium]